MLVLDLIMGSTGSPKRLVKELLDSLATSKAAASASGPRIGSPSDVPTMQMLDAIKGFLGLSPTCSQNCHRIVLQAGDQV